MAPAGVSEWRKPVGNSRFCIRTFRAHLVSMRTIGLDWILRLTLPDGQSYNEFVLVPRRRVTSDKAGG